MEKPNLLHHRVWYVDIIGNAVRMRSRKCAVTMRIHFTQSLYAVINAQSPMYSHRIYNQVVNLLIIYNM